MKYHIFLVLIVGSWYQNLFSDTSTPWTIVILGAQGDLAKRLLIPALYDIIKHHEATISIIATGRRPATVQEIIDAAMPFINKPSQDIIALLHKQMHYVVVDIEKPQDFEQLAPLMNTNHRLIYAAVASQYYCTATQYLVEAGIIHKGNHDHLMVYEKPFGDNSASARSLDRCITRYLTQEQIYRIDHYLAKSCSANILALRQANTIFEPVWNNHYIRRISITFNEKICLEGRGNFYDITGAIHDVVQNHLLQLLALVCMELPATITAQNIAHAKTQIFRHLKIHETCLGQFAGYRDEPGVAKESTTETFAALKLKLNTPRWRGVPLYLQTGKCLENKVVEIEITFKKNKLVIGCSPHDNISLDLQLYRQDKNQLLQTVPIANSARPPEIMSAYERLLMGIMAHDPFLQVSLDEIVAQWDIIKQAKKKSKAKLLTYTPGSSGPCRAQQIV